MGVEDIPDHFLVPIAFLYQADAQLRGAGGGAEGPDAGFAGRTKKLAQKMAGLGWHKALTQGKSANFAFLYNPKHWDEDDESYPPVTPKTDEAEDFLLDVQKGERLNFSVRNPETGKDVKSGIMDALVQELSGGKVQRFSLSAAARKADKERAEADGPLSAKLAGKPAQTTRGPAPAKELAGVDPWVPIPEPLVKSVGKRLDPERGDLDLAKVLDGAGLARTKKSGQTIWFDPSQWEAAVGGVGLLPLTDEAEMFQDRLTADAVLGVLPRNMIERISQALQVLIKKS